MPTGALGKDIGEGPSPVDSKMKAAFGGAHGGGAGVRHWFFSWQPWVNWIEWLGERLCAQACRLSSAVALGGNGKREGTWEGPREPVRTGRAAGTGQARQRTEGRPVPCWGQEPRSSAQWVGVLLAPNSTRQARAGEGTPLPTLLALSCWPRLSEALGRGGQRPGGGEELVQAGERKRRQRGESPERYPPACSAPGRSLARVRSPSARPSPASVPGRGLRGPPPGRGRSAPPPRLRQAGLFLGGPGAGRSPWLCGPPGPAPGERVLPTA